MYKSKEFPLKDWQVCSFNANVGGEVQGLDPYFWDRSLGTW